MNRRAFIQAAAVSGIGSGIPLQIARKVVRPVLILLAL